MYKNKKYLLFSFSILSFIFLTNTVFASANISSILLNGTAGNTTINPTNGESVTIDIRSSVPVKFTRLYICSVSQVCNGTSGNYTRYFTQSDVSDTISKSWNGKKSGDTEIVPEGEYKVMVSMTEGTNDPVLEFGQYSMFVNYGSHSTTTNQISSSTNSTSSNNVSNSVTNTIVRTVYVSAHSGQEELSNYTENTLDTSAGRERMALVGSIIEFNAKYSINPKIQCVPTFKWVFGDGFESVGKNVTHIYKYSGEYNIVLNTNCGEYNSVSRTYVKVYKPNIAIIINSSNDIEITNKSSSEINIGSWKIKADQKDFVLPKDTIISANNRIFLSKDDIGINDNTVKISLNNSQDREVAFYTKVSSDNNIISLATSTTDGQLEPQISVQQAESLLYEYKKTIGFYSQQPDKLPKNVENKEDLENSALNNTATVLEAVDNSKGDDFWSKLVSVPVKGIKGFIKMFYDF